MVAQMSEPKIITEADIDPGHNWKKALQAPGVMAVDFEERIDFQRLHRYRLARTRQALRNSELGAVLCFDANNIRYMTSTNIGEWSRDKMCRSSLLAGNAPPHQWDFGSAAAHHRLHAPWIPPAHFHAVMLGLRGAVPPDSGLMRNFAREIHDIMKANGVADQPLGIDIVEPPLLREFEKLGVDVRDGQQVMLDAREIKNRDEIMLLNVAAAMVDAVYQMIYEKLKPGVRENEIVGAATKMLFDMGADDVEAINAVSGERCSPHPHNFTDRIVRPGDQAFFDIIQAYMGYRTCYYRTINVGRANDKQRDAYKQCREWVDASINLIKPASRPTRSRRSGRRRRSSASRARWSASGSSSATASASRCTSGRSSAAWSRWTTRSRSRKAWCSRSRRIVPPRMDARRRASRKKSS